MHSLVNQISLFSATSKILFQTALQIINHCLVLAICGECLIRLEEEDACLMQSHPYNIRPG